MHILSKKDIAEMSEQDLQYEKEELLAKRRQLSREIDHIDTVLVGIREMELQLKEKKLREGNWRPEFESD